MKGGPAQDFLKVAMDYDGDDCLIWPFATTKAGYPMVWSKGKFTVASRVLCEMVHGAPPTADHQAAHSCGKGHHGCMAKRHLSWKSPAENGADKVLHGTSIRWSRNPNCVLTEQDVRAIRGLGGKITQVEIARQFGVAQTTIGKILRREKWQWLT